MGSEEDDTIIKTPATSFLRKGILWTFIGAALTVFLILYNLNSVNKLEKELYVLTGGVTAFGICQLIAAALAHRNSRNGFLEVMDDLNFLPHTMKKLAVVQFFSWFGLFAMWIYTTAAPDRHYRYTIKRV